MSYLHSSLAAGRWHTLSLAEQLGNIGSEIGRASKWQDRDPESFRGAVERALELFDLTVDDPRWTNRLKEILRAREFLLDAVDGGEHYGTTFRGLEQYFFHFAFASRISKDKDLLQRS